MPRYTFALSNVDGVREIGTVNTESFAEALDALGEHASVYEGDILEIGVRGFPPARFESVFSAEDLSTAWKPLGQMAA